MNLIYCQLLQKENYGDAYGWNILFGKGNYPCIHSDALQNAMADDCLYVKEGMKKCPFASRCPYLVAKSIAMGSGKASLNYAYYLSTQWAHDRKSLNALVLDEAHLLSDITLDYTGITINERKRQRWELPPFPRFPENTSIFFNDGEQQSKEEIILDWLREVYGILNRRKALYEKTINTDPDVRKKYKACDNFIRKILATVQSINEEKRGWFILGGRGIIIYSGRKIPGIIVRPLTARYHFPMYFMDVAKTTVLMSATIGDPDTFASELGISDYLFRRVPSPWLPEMRPVYNLPTPRMSKKSSQEDYEKQSDVIAEAILAQPHDWLGVIHVTRINEASNMAKRLSRRGLGERIWVPPIAGTNLQMEAWNEHKKKCALKHIAPIAIAWSWTEGVDLYNEKICILAKVPFPNLGDPFERARMGFDARFYLQRTAWSLQQALGRTRRGEREHYDVDGKVNGFVAIADRNWTRVKKYLSKDFLESIVEY